RPGRPARRAQLVLSARGQARGVRPAAPSRAADAEPPQERGPLGGERRRVGRAGVGGPAQAPHGRHGRPGRGRGRGRAQLMSDTFFSGAPRWTWYIFLFFLIRGLDGGGNFISGVLWGLRGTRVHNV